MKNYLLLMAGALVLSSCVSKKKFAFVQDQYTKTNKELVAAKRQLIETKQQNKASKNTIGNLEQKIDYLMKGNEKAMEYVSNLTVLSKNASENMKETLTQLRQKDDYIKYIQKLNSKRDSINLAVAFNLKQVLDNGLNDKDIQVNIEKTVVYISIADHLLFKTASYKVSKRADNILAKVAEVVNSQPEMDVIIEGHTDSRTIKNEMFEDNWDLSVKRATSIVRILQDKYEVAPERLVASGRASYKPLVENNNAANMAKNRRTKIILMPNLDQFFELLDSKQ